MVAGLLQVPDAPSVPTAPVAVYPPAETTTAHPATDVSVRGVAASDVEVVAVTGSHSGPVTTSLRAHRDGDGATIALDGSLQPRERVLVDLRVGGRRLRHRFSVAEVGAHPGVQRDEPAGSDRLGAASAPAAPPRYESRPDLQAPSITVTTPPAVERDGSLLATPRATAESAAGTMIFDDDGELVWFRARQEAGTTIGDLKVLELGGRQVLAWFEGTSPYGGGSYHGEWVVVDEAYHEVTRIRAGNGLQADIHDLQLTADGTALLLAYNPVVRDLSHLGGRDDALVLEAVVQEVDVHSGDVLFEWHSLDHIPVSDSYRAPTTQRVDYAHINAVEEDADGDLLLSLRHTSEIVKVDRGTGAVVWRLGGKHSSFDLGADDGISYPHDVRSTPAGVSIFDNGNLKDPQYSRGVVYDLDPGAGVATVVAEYRDTPEDSFGPTQGSFRLLEDGTASIAWGGVGTITEMTATGAETFEATIGAGSYRIIRQEWTGRPAEPPAVAAAPDGAGTLVHASWNGATEVASWEVLAGPGPSRLDPVATAPRDGFETAISLPERYAFVAVRARDGQGRPLGRSAAVPTSSWYEERPSREATGTYQPIVGHFVDGPEDDVFWYGPGAVPESLWPADGTQFGATVGTRQINGDWQTVVGDFFGDDHDEIVFWQPGSTLAHVWRWADGVPTSASVRIPAADEAVLLDHAAGPDEVLWYARGAAPDRIDGFRRSGAGVRTISRPAAVAGSYVTASGDFDANGWADVLWYQPGGGGDYVWYMSGTSGPSSSHASHPVSVNGHYTPVVGRFDDSGDAADDVLWVGGSDHLWSGRTNRTFTSTPVDVPEGQPVLVPGARDHVLQWAPQTGSHIVRSATGTPFVVPTGNTQMPATAIPVVGDFTQPGQASIFWYRPGPGQEALYVSPG